MIFQEDNNVIAYWISSNAALGGLGTMVHVENTVQDAVEGRFRDVCPHSSEAASLTASGDY